MQRANQEFISYLLKNGIARTNRFQVLIPLPLALQEKISNIDQPKTTTWLNHDILKLINSYSGSSSNEITRGLNIMVMNAEIPGKNLATSDVKYNGDFYSHAHDIVYSTFPIMFRVTRDMYEKNIIDEWMNLIVNPVTHNIEYLDNYVVGITINQLDEQNNVVYSVLLKDAFPTLCNSLFSSNDEFNQHHKLSCTFAYRRWERVGENEHSKGPFASLSQTILGPILTPILSNPAVQRALDVFEKETGIDLEGEALNIYNQMEKVVRTTTGTSINKTVGFLNEMKVQTAINGKITDFQKSKLIDLFDKVINSMKF